MSAAATELLLARGADEIRHPGGTLFEHLRRVHATLDAWGARPELRLAGLCHAFYGTDGFAVPLGGIDRRPELAEVIGDEAERLVHLYARCDRARTYPGLGEPGGLFVDRFSGTPLVLSPGERRDFAELTVANELDVLRYAGGEADPSQFAPLLELFTSWGPLLSAPARRAVHRARRT
ncbi:DUF6817 domain-containing protein [Actinomadura miaoliensis]|uniref:DUF6817 domain-containing protein n=1 Tax=Actinomadura miaoliensis TaxID=430685 RepID=A0ABP7VBC3_9ACTN